MIACDYTCWENEASTLKPTA